MYTVGHHPSPARGSQWMLMFEDHCSRSPIVQSTEDRQQGEPVLKPTSCVCMHAQSFQSCPTLCNPMDCSPPGSSVHGDSPGKNTGVGCHALLQRIFPTQGSNPGLPHCRQILYQLSHQGTPSIKQWVDYRISPKLLSRNNVGWHFQL